MAAINNCTTILTDPAGEYNLTAAETLLAFSSLSLYTTAESCPMVYLLPLPIHLFLLSLSLPSTFH